MVTWSPGFQLRTAEPTRSTTPAASLPITWTGWSWRAPHTLSLPRRLRNWNVGNGSKMDVHTVLKLIAGALEDCVANASYLRHAHEATARRAARFELGPARLLSGSSFW